MLWSVNVWDMEYIALVHGEDLTTMKSTKEDKYFYTGGCGQLVADDIIARVGVSVVFLVKISMDVFTSGSFKRMGRNAETALKAL